MKRWINADSVISGMDGDIRGYNGFSYCENNPIIFCDLFGTSPDYSQYGFYYDGSVRDFKRLEQGLPPYSYELFLQNGGYVYPKQKVYEGYGETIILYSVKYDTKEQAEKVLEKKKEDRGITKILNDAGTGLSVAGAFNSSNWISIAGGVIAIAYKIFKGLDDADAYVYESTAKSGNGVFTVTWMYYGRYQDVIEIYYEKLEDIHR